MRIPVSRVRAGYRGALWFCLAAILVLPAIVIWPTLRFDPLATSNRFVEYSWAVILAGLVLIGLFVFGIAARWLALMAWPTRVGIAVDDEGLRFLLGPFGQHTFDWDRMKATYCFEMSLDAEAFPDVVDPDEEVRSYLPRLAHPDAPPGQLNRWFRSYVSQSEAQLANQLRLYIENIRQSNDLRGAVTRSRVRPQANSADNVEPA